ncbi:MAG: hypothetical protein JXA90_05305 [Planctomycetes bacterium]|nr:hypothetical protein [Planctomycetota bacterium]
MTAQIPPDGESPPRPPERERARTAYRSIAARLEAIRRRLFLAGALRWLCADLLLCVSLAAVLIAAERIFSLGVGEGVWIGGALLGAIAFTIVRAAIRGRVRIADAARAADERLALKERLATAVYLEEAPRRPALEPWQCLICEDGARRLEGVRLAERFPVRPPRTSWWLLAPAAACALILLFVPEIDVLGRGARRRAVAEEREAVEIEKEELAAELEKIAKEAEEKQFEELKKLIDSLRDREAGEPRPPEPASERPPESGGEPKKEALIELARKEDAILKALSSERNEAVARAIEGLQKLSLEDVDLTRRLRQSLKEGDLEKSREEIESLERDIETLSRKRPSELTPEEQDRLRRLSEELSRLARDSAALQGLSRSLSAAADSLDAESLSRALDALELSREELEALARQVDETELLERSLELVRWTKEDLRSIRQALDSPGSEWCPECGRRRGLPRPGEKPGST